MKNIITVVAYLIFLTTLISCYNLEEKEVECGPLKTFTVDKSFIKKWDFPELEFSLDYHENMETIFPIEGKKNINYASFIIKDKDSIWTESFGLGKFKANGYASDEADNLKLSLLDQFGTMYKSVFTIKDEFKGKKEINGKEYLVYEAKGSIDKADVGFKGDYLLKLMLVEPKKNAKHGLIYIMQANTDSPIKSFEDFGKKGCTATIYQSLKFK